MKPTLFVRLILTATLFVYVATPARMHAAAVRVLPIGDSITLGLSVPGGYRAPLYQLLTNAGYTVL